MTVPAGFELASHRYTLAYDDALAHRGANGETYAERLEVLIVPGLPPTVEREVVFHELLHACWHLTGLRAPGHAAEPFEEEIIGALAPLALEILRRNPRLSAYLTE